MVIEVTGNKYNVGCGRGYGVDIPNLTLKLNLIVDRDRSTWPTPVDKRTQEEKDAGVPGPSTKTEIEFSYFEDDDNDYSWDELKELPEDTEFSEYTPPYEWMKIWRENFVQDRNLRPDYTIKVEIKDLMLGFTREFYMKSAKVYYLGDQFSEEELKYYLHKTLCWFYAEIGRIKPKTK